MFVSFLTSVVDFSRKFAVFLVAAAMLSSIGLGVYVARNIAINTDINQLLSENLVWRKREKALEAAFPQKVDNLIVVIDGDDGAKAENATAALANKLTAMPDNLTFVSRPDALPFFRNNGLLFLSKEELADALDRGHDQRVRDAAFERREERFVIRVTGLADLSLERLSLAEKGDMFEDVFGLEPILS